MASFLPENDFQTSSAVNFPRNILILEAWKPTEDMKFRLEFFSICPSTVSKSIMTAQKCKKKLLTKIFGVFECLPTNPKPN